MKTITSTPRSVSTQRLANGARRVGFGLAIALVLLPAAFVFFWMLTSALKRQVDIYAIPPRWFDFSPNLDNFRRAFDRTPFLRYAANSSIVAVASSLAGVVIGVPAAYAIARFRKHRLALVILAARILPGVSYLVPFFVIFSQLGMVGTYRSLVLSHLVVTLPLTVYIMISFFDGLPGEVLEAARVDGCSELQTFWRVALPLTKPGLVTAVILAFIFSWNDFKMALILSDSQTRTLPVAVFNFINEASLDWGPMMAYATIITFPVLVLTLFIQKHIVTGMTMGSVK